MANTPQNHHEEVAIRPAIRARSPDAVMGRSGCCGGFLCLGFRKRGKRIAPTTRMQGGSNSSSRPWGANGALQSDASNQYASLSPSLLAPPSSPASFQNSAVQSSAQSPSVFPVVLPGPSATSQIPLETTATMFQMGPYAHETALVSPPVFSTFTTAPSTAPFTPPPELATHVTTPSSPDVPFAQLLASSFGIKGSVRLQPAPTYSASPFASPDIFAADDLQGAYQLYPGSPLAHLLSPTSGTGESTPFPDLEISSQCTFPDVESSVQAVASMFFPASSLITSEPATSMELDVESLLSQALNSCSFQKFRRQEQQLSSAISSFLECGDDSAVSKLVGHMDSEIGEQWMDEGNKVSGGCHRMKLTRVFESPTDADSFDEDGIEVTGESRNKEEHDTGPSGLSLSDHASSVQHQQRQHESSDQADRSLGQVTVICNIGCSQTVMMSPNIEESAEAMVKREVHPIEFKASLASHNYDDTVSSDQADRSLSQVTVICNIGCSQTVRMSPCMEESAGAMVDTEVHPLKFKSSFVGQNSGDNVKRGTSATNKTPMKVRLLGTPLTDKGRTDGDICGSTTELVSERASTAFSSHSDSEDSADCVILRPVLVADSKGYCEATTQWDLAGEGFRAECDFTEQNREDCCSRYGQLEKGNAKVKIAPKHAMQGSVGIEVKDTVAVCR